jgi:hypothetical protein
MKKLFLLLTLTLPGFAQLCVNVSPNSMNCPVDSITGVTANDSAIWDSGGVGVQIGATTNSANSIIGWADQTVAAAGGQVLIHTFGPGKMNFDGATTAGDAFTRSTTTNGQFTDTGVVYSSATCAQGTLGVINQTIGSTGLATATWKPCIGAGTVASGTAAMGTGAIANGACATVVTVSATGVLSTDTIIYGPNTNPTGITGYIPGASVYIWAVPTSGNVNFYVCNGSGSSVTPSALTLNWRVIR